MNQEKNMSLDEQIADLRQQVTNLDSKITQASQQKDKLKKQIEELREQKDRLKVGAKFVYQPLGNYKYHYGTELMLVKVDGLYALVIVSSKYSPSSVGQQWSEGCKTLNNEVFGLQPPSDFCKIS